MENGQNYFSFDKFQGRQYQHLWLPTQTVIACLGGYNKTPQTAQTGQLISNRKFSQLMELEVQDQVPAQLYFDEGLLPDSLAVAFSLCSHMVEGLRNLCEVSFVRTLITFTRAPLSQRSHLLRSSHWTLGFQHINFGGIQILRLYAEQFCSGISSVAIRCKMQLNKGKCAFI